MSTIVKEPAQVLPRLVWDVKVERPHLNGLHEEPKSKAGMRVSEEEYWIRYYEDPDFSYEWNNGILEEKPVSSVQGVEQYSWECRIIDAFIETNPIARAMRLEMGYRMGLEEKTTIRKPDLFVVRNDNALPLQARDRSYWGTCDLCVEALSDSDESEVTRDVVTKRNEYEAAGVREYYILDPNGEHTVFYYRNAQGRYEEIPIDPDGIVRSRVLPGFQFRLQDLYRLPSMVEMADDEVYRHYVMPAYHREKERANQAEARAEQERQRAAEADARAEQERQRAEQERQRAAEADARAERERLRAERLAAQLRALGVLEE